MVGNNLQGGLSSRHIPNLNPGRRKDRRARRSESFLFFVD
jgi:hypothetical protein